MIGYKKKDIINTLFMGPNKSHRFCRSTCLKILKQNYSISPDASEIMCLALYIIRNRSVCIILNILINEI